MIRGKKILGALLAFTLCFSMVIPAQADDISDAKKEAAGAGTAEEYG